MKNQKDESLAWIETLKKETALSKDRLEITIGCLRLWAVASEKAERSVTARQIADESMECARIAAKKDWGEGTEILVTKKFVEVENMDGRLALFTLGELRMPGFEMQPRNLRITKQAAT